MKFEKTAGLARPSFVIGRQGREGADFLGSFLSESVVDAASPLGTWQALSTQSGYRVCDAIDSLESYFGPVTVFVFSNESDKES